MCTTMSIASVFHGYLLYLFCLSAAAVFVLKKNSFLVVHGDVFMLTLMDYVWKQLQNRVHVLNIGWRFIIICIFSVPFKPILVQTQQIQKKRQNNNDVREKKTNGN